MEVGEKGEESCRIKCTNLATWLNKVGMKKQKRNRTTLTPQETQLMERLRSHPEMMARVQAILEIAHNEDGPLKTADEVEDLLVEEMRRLGNATMNRWAFQAEERVMTELKSQDATVLSRKKKR